MAQATTAQNLPLRDTPAEPSAELWTVMELRHRLEAMPAGGDEPEGAGERPEGEGTAPAPPLRILVVDDNRDSADSLGMLFRLLGHDVRTAHDGLQAVAAAEEFRPDAMVLDIGLPKLDGYEVARQLRRLDWGRRTTLIAVTGWGQEEDKERSKEAGIDHHLVKPVDPSALLELLTGKD